MPSFSCLVICLFLVSAKESNNIWVWSYQQETSCSWLIHKLPLSCLPFQIEGQNIEWTRKLKGLQTHTNSTYKGKEGSINKERNYKYHRPNQEKIFKKWFRKIRYREKGKLFSCGKKSFLKMLINCFFSWQNMVYTRYSKRSTTRQLSRQTFSSLTVSLAYSLKEIMIVKWKNQHASYTRMSSTRVWRALGLRISLSRKLTMSVNFGLWFLSFCQQWSINWCRDAGQPMGAGSL